LDFSKFKVHDWLMIGGGAAMLLLGLALDWTSVSIAGFSTSGDGPFDYLLTGGIAWMLVVGVGVLALLNKLGNLPASQPWPLIFLGATGLAAILMILRILLGARFDGADRGTGMYGAVVWTGISLAGAFMNFTASGGNVNDLKDMSKLKASFGGDKADDDLPPPPPPPPPPAPPAV